MSQRFFLYWYLIYQYSPMHLKQEAVNKVNQYLSYLFYIRQYSSWLESWFSTLKLNHFHPIYSSLISSFHWLFFIWQTFSYSPRIYRGDPIYSFFSLFLNRSRAHANELCDKLIIHDNFYLRHWKWCSPTCVCFCSQVL